jgi:hypothetical protein
MMRRRIENWSGKGNNTSIEKNGQTVRDNDKGKNEMMLDLCMCKFVRGRNVRNTNGDLWCDDSLSLCFNTYKFPYEHVKYIFGFVICDFLFARFLSLIFLCVCVL